MDKRQEVLDMIEIYTDEPKTSKGGQMVSWVRTPPVVAEHKELGIKIRLDIDKNSLVYKKQLATTLMEIAIDELCKF